MDMFLVESKARTFTCVTIYVIQGENRSECGMHHVHTSETTEGDFLCF